MSEIRTTLLLPDLDDCCVAVIGGTGALGGGLAHMAAKAGLRVVIGSRDAGRAQEAAAECARKSGNDRITGAEQKSAAEEADIVIIAVPFGSLEQTLDAISGACEGKLVIDTSVCLRPPAVRRVQLPPEGSAGLITTARLDNAFVTSAFQHISAHKMYGDTPPKCDVLVAGDSRDARSATIGFVQRLGLKGYHAGSSANSIALEALTSVLITINHQHRIDGAGIAITGAPKE